MSEYPDRVLLSALNDLAAKGSRWVPGFIKGRIQKRKFGDAVMIFSLDDGGLPLLASVYVPWLLVWESLASRMYRGRCISVGVDNPAFSSVDLGEAMEPQTGLCLSDLDEAIKRVQDGGGTVRPIVSVECSPAMPYTFQLLPCYGGLCASVKIRHLDLGLKYELGWVLAEAGMLAHYCAGRLRVPADRLIVTVTDCFLPRGVPLGRKQIGPCAYLRQPRVCFARIAKSCKECFPGDLFVNGYMRVSKSVCDINGIYATSASTIKRAMSVGAMAALSNLKVALGSSKTSGCDVISDLQQKTAYF